MHCQNRWIYLGLCVTISGCINYTTFKCKFQRLSGQYWSSLGSRFVAHFSRILEPIFNDLSIDNFPITLSHISSAQLKRTGSDSINQSMHDICNLIFIQRQKFWVSFFSAAIVVQNWKSTCACRFLQRNQFMEGFIRLIMQACVRKIHPNF